MECWKNACLRTSGRQAMLEEILNGLVTYPFLPAFIKVTAGILPIFHFSILPSIKTLKT